MSEVYVGTSTVCCVVVLRLEVRTPFRKWLVHLEMCPTFAGQAPDSADVKVRHIFSTLGQRAAGIVFDHVPNVCVCVCVLFHCASTQLMVLQPFLLLASPIRRHVQTTIVVVCVRVCVSTSLLTMLNTSQHCGQSMNTPHQHLGSTNCVAY